MHRRGLRRVDKRLWQEAGFAWKGVAQGGQGPDKESWQKAEEA